MERIDIENSWPDIWGYEDWNWYDGIAYYENINTKQRYSRKGYPIDKDEMCKYWKIYKVKCERYWNGTFDYRWIILSSRPDGDETS